MFSLKRHELLLTFNNSLGDSRFAGFLCKQATTKALKLLLQEAHESEGDSAFGIKNKAFIGCKSKYGGFLFASSIAVIPIDQMSAYI